MNPTILHLGTSWALALTATLALSTCDAVGPAAPAAQPATDAPQAETLALREGPAAGDRVTVDLLYARRDGQVAPRMMELWLEVGPGLAWAGATALDAVEAAGKELVVQPSDGALRVIVFASSNTTTLDSGGLARLAFRPTGAGAATVALVAQLPVFAPASANDGLLLGPPLTIDHPTSAGGTR